MRKSFILVTVILALASCSGKSEKETGGEYVSTIAAGGESEEELKKNLEEYQKLEAERLAEEKSRTTTLEYDKLMHDFGEVKAGSTNTCQFIVTNTGDKPLIIEKVSASCGCTTPKKPEKPIAPGKSDIIEVAFKPNPGQENEIQKTVTVEANTIPHETKIEIKAFVIAAK